MTVFELFGVKARNSQGLECLLFFQFSSRIRKLLPICVSVTRKKNQLAINCWIIKFVCWIELGLKNFWEEQSQRKKIKSAYPPKFLKRVEGLTKRLGAGPDRSALTTGTPLAVTIEKKLWLAIF